MHAAEPEPVVDGETTAGIRDALQRVLETVAPDSLVAGGGQEFESLFSSQSRDLETLRERETIYRTGGPVTDMVDSRSLMTYGTGAAFESDAAMTDDAGRTVDEWLHEQLPNLDLFHIEAGIQSYWAGDAWAEIVTTRSGEFSHLTLVDPTTVDVAWDDHGEITGLRQVIESANRRRAEPLDVDRVAHFWHKRTTSGPLGESLIEQNRDEIQMFAQNLRQRRNAIKQHGSPKFDVTVGSESGQQIPDSLLRRVRQRIFGAGGVDENTNLVHGGGISIETLEAPGFEGMDNIVETDARILSWGFGIPLEYTNMGSAGLGEGTPAESRKLKFERQARAEQKLRSAQFIEQVIRPILEEFSPFPRDIELRHVFGDVVSDQQASAEWMRDFKSYLTPAEVRERLDLPPDVDTEELGPPEGTPDAEGADIGGGGGLFSRDEPDTDEAPDPLGDDEEAKERYANGGRDMGNGRTLLHADADAEALTQEELVWAEVYDRVLWADTDAAAERALFEFDPEEVPQFVVQRLEEAITAGALFGDFETVPRSAVPQIRDALIDSLETQHGWSINSLRENLTDAVPGLDGHDAERIARTETASLVNTARETGYREEFDLDEERFKWVGPENSRTTAACSWLKSQTNPAFGGEPVSLDRLRELVAEAPSHDADLPDGMARPNDWVVHINERHTYTRVV